MADGRIGKPVLTDFIILKVIGRGVMGKVLLVRHKRTGKLFALKSVHKQWILSHSQNRSAQSERNILTTFREFFNNLDGEGGNLRKFLIQLHATFQTPTEIFHVLDFEVGGDLASVLSRESRLEEPLAQFLAAEIAVGLSLLHAQGIVYRDLKPENVLLDAAGHVVLTDFGMSKILSPSHRGSQENQAIAAGKTNTFCGTAEYLAPEVISRQAYDQAVDWWSFGTMLYEMLVGLTPFWCEIPAQMYKQILSEEEIYFPTSVGEAARDLIKQLLAKNPGDRPNIQGIKRHPFFVNVSWQSVEDRRLASPFIKLPQSEADTSAFDDEFTMLNAIITPADRETLMLLNRPENQEPFRGFSYYPEFDM